MTHAECVAVWKAAREADDTKLQRMLKSLRPDLMNWRHHIHGTTALMAAAEGRRGEGAVWQLIAAGADVNAIDNTNLKNTVLHYAAMTNQNSLTVDALLESGADAFVTNHQGLLPLDLARQYRREDVAAALMEHMKVHSGWLYMCGSLHWKKRWGVVIACNNQRTSRELCIFRHPRDIRPEAVLLIDESARASSHVDSVNCSWFKRKYAFTFDKPVMWQCVKRQKLTRSPICHKTMSREDVHIENLAFAADNLHNLECWQRVLQSNNFYDRETGAPLHGMSPYDAPHRDLYYWPHELVQNVRSTISRQQEVRKGDSKALIERSIRSRLRSEDEELLANSLQGFQESNYADGNYPALVQTPKTIDVAQLEQRPLSNEKEQSYRSGLCFEAIHTSSPRQTQQIEQDPALCPKCCVRDRNAVCAPCGHRAGCHACLMICASQFCPVCRARVHSIIRVYD